ncbi:MAG: AMP-binding protein, partial [Planctomycetes bacterium]|nr:AMP-binding protein [Planctomycetota bacterium]
RGKPRAVILSPVPIEVPVIDIRSIPVSNREREWTRLAREEQQTPFDFESGQLTRIVLVQLANDEHILLISMHHAVTDAWSYHNIWNELSEFYKADIDGRDAELLDVTETYRQLAEEQWLMTDRPERSEHVDYWARQLADLTPLNLPYDAPRPKIPNFQGTRIAITIRRELMADVERLARKERVTPFMVLMAAFQTLMFRYSGQTDFAVGTPTAGRMSANVESLVGCFVNTLVIRANCSEKPSFTRLLRRVRDTMLSAWQHQDVDVESLLTSGQSGLVQKGFWSRYRNGPQGALHNDSRPLFEPQKSDRLSCHDPLIQVVFALRNTPAFNMKLDGLTVERIDLDFHTTKFDLLLNLWPSSEGLSGHVEYSTELFQESTVNQLMQHFVNLLEGIVADPQCSLSELPMLSIEERSRILEEWNNTSRQYPQEKSIPDLFLEQVAATPDAVAIVCGDRRLSYSELNDRVERLAAALHDRGIVSETLVGLRADRSIELIVGMLAVLRLGGAYVPLDSENPSERQMFIVKNAGIEFVLDQDDLSVSDTVSVESSSDQTIGRAGMHNLQNSSVEHVRERVIGMVQEEVGSRGRYGPK